MACAVCGSGVALVKGAHKGLRLSCKRRKQRREEDARDDKKITAMVGMVVETLIVKVEKAEARPFFAFFAFHMAHGAWPYGFSVSPLSAPVTTIIRVSTRSLIGFLTSRGSIKSKTQKMNRENTTDTCTCR